MAPMKVTQRESLNSASLPPLLLFPKRPAYAPNLVEGEFCELRVDGFLRSSLFASNA
jgi:hypothetical protein